MIARERVISTLKAIRILIAAGRVDDAVVLIDGFEARLEGAEPEPIAYSREPLRLISGGRDAS